jgi:hypothetical protein
LVTSPFWLFGIVSVFGVSLRDLIYVLVWFVFFSSVFVPSF